MIRFQCPTCLKRLKAPDEGTGRKISCPRCGQRLLIPAPIPVPVQNKTVLGQSMPDSAASFMPFSVHPQSPADPPDLDSVAILGLRKDAELEREGLQQPGYKPARSWAGTVFGVVALMLGIAGMPVAVANQLLGPALAGLGVLLGIFGMFMAVLRGRGAGFLLSFIGPAVCCSALLAGLLLLPKGVLPFDAPERRRRAESNGCR